MSHVSAPNDRGTPAAQAASISAALQALQAENAELQTRLADAIRLCSDCKQLDTLEEFQGRFIATDMVIALLRREVSTSGIGPSVKGAAVGKMQANMSVDLQRMREQFHSLKSEFEQYIAGVAPPLVE